ncbi:MAG: hypothetical protein ACLGH0_15595, partial [Thermoanaerobaculia bacterium]
AAALLVGATALAVKAFDDRALFVPPPDAVAEGFTRELATKRYDRAQPYLVKEAPEAELRELAKRIGDPNEVEAEIVARDDQRALVNVRVKSAKHSDALAYELVFEDEWKVVWADR